MMLGFRYLLATAATCCLSAQAKAGPVATYLRESSKGREEMEYAASETRFQVWLREPSLLTFDRGGTIRNAAGRPVGWWGVDGPRAAALRR